MGSVKIFSLWAYECSVFDGVFGGETRYIITRVIPRVDVPPRCLEPVFQLDGKSIELLSMSWNIWPLCDKVGSCHRSLSDSYSNSPHINLSALLGLVDEKKKRPFPDHGSSLFLLLLKVYVSESCVRCCCSALVSLVVQSPITIMLLYNTFIVFL